MHSLKDTYCNCNDCASFSASRQQTTAAQCRHCGVGYTSHANLRFLCAKCYQEGKAALYDYFGDPDKLTDVDRKAETLLKAMEGWVRRGRAVDVLKRIFKE